MSIDDGNDYDVCEEEGHDWAWDDIADGVVRGGLDHVYVVYCRRCGAEGTPEDLE